MQGPRNVPLGPLEPLVARIYRHAKRLPIVKERLEAEYAPTMKSSANRPSPTRARLRVTPPFPQTAKPARTSWRRSVSSNGGKPNAGKMGTCTGAVYHGDPEHIAFLNEAYAITSQTNPLHSDLWPSIAKYEAEIVLDDRQHAQRAAGCGTPKYVVQYRVAGPRASCLRCAATADWARDTKGITLAGARCADDRACGFRQVGPVLRDQAGEGAGWRGLPGGRRPRPRKRSTATPSVSSDRLFHSRTG